MLIPAREKISEIVCSDEFRVMSDICTFSLLSQDWVLSLPFVSCQMCALAKDLTADVSRAQNLWWIVFSSSESPVPALSAYHAIHIKNKWRTKLSITEQRRQNCWHRISFLWSLLQNDEWSPKKTVIPRRWESITGWIYENWFPIKVFGMTYWSFCKGFSLYKKKLRSQSSSSVNQCGTYRYL